MFALEQMGFSTQILDQTSINITGYPSLLEKRLADIISRHYACIGFF